MTNVTLNVPVVVGTNVLRTLSAETASKAVSTPIQEAISFLSYAVPDNHVGLVKAIKTEVLPPKSRVLVHGTAQISTPLPRLTVMTEESSQHQLPGGILVSQCLINVGKEAHGVVVELVNLSDRERSLQSGSILCELQSVVVESLGYSGSSAEDEDWLKKFDWPADAA